MQVVHHYLRSTKKGVQSRLRKRVKSGRATYTFTVRKPEVQGQVVEVKNPISQRDYANLLDHRDDNHLPIFKTRRCFLYQNQQYSLDIYRYLYYTTTSFLPGSIQLGGFNPTWRFKYE